MFENRGETRRTGVKSEESVLLQKSAFTVRCFTSESEKMSREDMAIFSSLLCFLISLNGDFTGDLISV